jgi:hypothetical protein
MSVNCLIARRFGGGRFVDQLPDHQRALGDPAPLAILGDLDLLVERLGEQGCEVLRALRPALGFPDRPF